MLEAIAALLRGSPLTPDVLVARGISAALVLADAHPDRDAALLGPDDAGAQRSGGAADAGGAPPEATDPDPVLVGGPRRTSVRNHRWCDAPAGVTQNGSDS